MTADRGKLMAPYRIGLTGNIATGKSLVLRRLGELGACTLDADQLAHARTCQGEPAWDEIRRRFGEAVLQPGGDLDRAALGRVVFADASGLRDLEAILHPRVAEEVERRLANCSAQAAVVEAIKLLEASLASRCQAIWVTTCSPDRQVERLVVERGLSQEQALLRMHAQPPAALKVQRADVLLENDGSSDELLHLVDVEWHEIQAGAAPSQSPGPDAPVRTAGTWHVREGRHEAVARSLSPSEWRLVVTWPSRMPRLCRLLLPAIEEEALRAGLVRLTLRIQARTGYRQFLIAMGYEEKHDGGREPGESSFSRGLCT